MSWARCWLSDPYPVGVIFSRGWVHTTGKSLFSCCVERKASDRCGAGHRPLPVCQPFARSHGEARTRGAHRQESHTNLEIRTTALQLAVQGSRKGLIRLMPPSAKTGVGVSAMSISGPAGKGSACHARRSPGSRGRGSRRRRAAIGPVDAHACTAADRFHGTS